ncbi:cysteine desulfurase [Leptospira koniambonensis]|uniref:Cysteine desulfurase n=1 Tax=Leptospira koniambonensis TaxID=2484950 RepID=A0A4R9JDS8_9LEPT|nr:family 2A encapsulin nanocompartment cargo protein cysteine desulfurase [Leptospira koniambonensis]TGL36696.1 cysteine desulfurase [Leptospira koniambonensis]
MSTNDFSPEYPGEFSWKDSPPVDPNLIAEWSKNFFGPLSSGSNVDELVLSSSKIPNEIPADSQGIISQAESASKVNSWTSSSGAGYTRVPDLGLSGVGVPTFPGGLNVPGSGQGLPRQNSPFSFLDEFRSFESQAQNIQISDPFSFSPSLVPSVDISSGNFDLSYARKDFPILEERVNGRNLVWLDNAATTHKPQAVIDRLSYFYKHENSNIHRGAHTLAARATDAYEAAREKVKGFLNSSSTEEIVFVRGATEAINLVAQTWGRQNIGKDDEILISWLEHHANIVPWQMLCSEKGAKLKVIPVDETGQIILSEYQRLLTPKTRIVAFTQVSNALGTVTPAGAMIELAHKQGAKVLLDGAQAVSHMPVDVQALDCDFYVFSGHKVFAPTGIGVLFGKKEILDQMTPWQGGGNMIQDVTFERTVYQPAPFRFEAGTGNIADAVGLGAAIDYLNKFGMIRIAEYEHSLLEYGTKELKKIPGLKMIGTAPDKAGVLSFVLEGFKTEDVGRYLAQEGIAVRSGHHCAQPILRRFGLESTVRPSLAFYNTCEDIDALIRALYDLKGGRTSGPL